MKTNKAGEVLKYSETDLRWYHNGNENLSNNSFAGSVKFKLIPYDNKGLGFCETILTRNSPNSSLVHCALDSTMMLK